MIFNYSTLTSAAMMLPIAPTTTRAITIKNIVSHPFSHPDLILIYHTIRVTKVTDCEHFVTSFNQI
ncbi:hypothetical protein [Mesobacillus zeae]|uniref:hypothetical protein n=1 Tax=Mesobacillus zeae TaxID=1917180 RepID=UPI00115E5133|nr:hypothetical protein [Mesobacillus zeae]